MENHQSHAHRHNSQTRAQQILSSLSPEEAAAVVAALYDYSKTFKSGDKDPQHINAIAKGISSAALAGHMVPNSPGEYH